MKKKVAVIHYEKPFESVRKAVELAGGFEKLASGHRVFIKPNIVYWTKEVVFPKWGVITTSRVIEDMIVLLKERGISDITIGEGVVTRDPKDRETPAHAFEYLGYRKLEQKYGVRVINVMDRPFVKKDLGDGVKLSFNQDIMESDYVVDLPVMKAHNLTQVSLGIKNLKGTIDIPSRKRCHSADPEKDLHFMISRLADQMPPIFTLADGIYTTERGPAFDGRQRRSNLLVASNDILSADLVGARILGYDPAEISYLAHAAKNRNRPTDLSDIEVSGEKIEDVASFHDYDFEYAQNDDGEWLPAPMAKQGIKGISYRKFDSSMCTYCSGVNGIVLSAIRFAWDGTPFDKVEVLTGKSMSPTPGMNKTILLGKCMCKAHKDSPHIKEAIEINGCPPSPDKIVDALHRAGIKADPSLFEGMDKIPAFFMVRYQGKPEFEESFFRIET